MQGIPWHSLAVHIPMALPWIMCGVLVLGKFSRITLPQQAYTGAALVMVCFSIVSWYTGIAREPVVVEALSLETDAIRMWQYHRDFAKIYVLLSVLLLIGRYVVQAKQCTEQSDNVPLLYAIAQPIARYVPHWLDQPLWWIAAAVAIAVGHSGGSLLYQFGSAVP